MARKYNSKKEDKASSKNETKDKKRTNQGSKGGHKSKNATYDTTADGRLESAGRDNNPNWYFTDPINAEQLSQLSFNNFAGNNIEMSGLVIPTTTILTYFMNPCPGVTTVATPYTLKQSAGINLAGYRLYTKITAFTGRGTSYGPQDLSTMILLFGELISQIEWIRRGFGIAYTMNPRNRDYPRTVLQEMGIDPDDLAVNMSSYRTMFNTIITLVNQLPIPATIAYFDKCASLYEKVYLDQPSSMAQTIIPSMATTWAIDDTGYAGGTVCRTQNWNLDKASGAWLGIQNMNVYLNATMQNVKDMLNSTAFQVVYADILNLATKISTPFWHFDMLSDMYTVLPEYNQNFMLQFHNMTFTNTPNVLTDESELTSGATPYNDVYPDPTSNIVFYNPVMSLAIPGSGGTATHVPNSAILDMLTDNPSTEDRIEVTRFLSLAGWVHNVSGVTNGVYDMVLPDHYAIYYRVHQSDNTSMAWASWVSDTNVLVAAKTTSEIDWAPRFYYMDANTGNWLAEQVGDLNFYTTVDKFWLRKVHDFVSLALYDLR